MQDNLAIKVDNVSKTFILPHEKNNSLKNKIINFTKTKKTYEKQHVLDNISFEVKKGEFFGIIGRNGSGKSTLLKILAGIYSSDAGNVSVYGKLTPFIELGVGFSPELTGRDNVFLNGALLGFSRKEMLSMYDDIVDFAGLEKSMDQKLKNYSSGMQVRLAFSIAIRADTDILVLDEVLAVGDENFQKKCLEVFREYKKSDKTIILVSHSTGDIEKFCDRVLVLEKSKQLGVFGPVDAVNKYQELNFEQTIQTKDKNGNSKRWGSKEIFVKKIFMNTEEPQQTGAKIEIKICLEVKKISNKPRPVTLGLAIYDEESVNISGPNSKKEKLFIRPNEKMQDFIFSVEKNPLNKGAFNVTVGLFDEDNITTYDYWIDAITFNVISESESHGKINLSGIWGWA